MRFPVVVVFQAGSDQKDTVFIAPFSPAHATGGIRFAVRIASAEDYQNTAGFPRIITTRDPILEYGQLVLQRKSLDFDRVGRES